ncbi:MAG TPA: nucleotide sugar dehydrogenase [Candidatus Pelethocola excrementipullorum]|nr:nucleotide sugar dehydrogenase [Candidatus Pelethocola excrementipullorum]
MFAQVLKKKILDRTAKVAVIGLGYVGLPNAINKAESGYIVKGIDLNQEKIQKLNSGISYIIDISNERVENYLKTSEFTTNFDTIEDCDVIFIAVPTPIDEFNIPDMSYLDNVSKIILSHARKGQLIILESTTYPTSTDEFFVKPLQQAGFTIGSDIFIVFSPERIDPGNKLYQLENTPKVVGGYTETCKDLGATMIGNRAHTVSSLETAEMAKLFENTFRFVNIALADELSKLCSELNISSYEVLDAAATKPFGFMKFTPSAKIGGHCIAVDPYYLQWYMKGRGMSTPLIDASGAIDQSMVSFLKDKIIELLTLYKIPIYDSKIAVIGVSYKENVPDTRMSCIPALYNELKKLSIDTDIYDPYVDSLNIDDITIPVLDIDYEKLKQADLTIIITAHDCIDYSKLANGGKIILDTKGVYKTEHDNIHVL